VDAPIVPVGADPRTDLLAVPASVSTIGWYRYGSSPGSSGSVLLVGHVDSAARGAGVLFHLRQMRPGAAIDIRLSDGSWRRFATIALRTYAKGRLPSRLFARSGPEVLALVTCDGPFDPGTGHYTDNVVVYAVPKAR